MNAEYLVASISFETGQITLEFVDRHPGTEIFTYGEYDRVTGLRWTLPPTIDPARVRRIIWDAVDEDTRRRGRAAYHPAEPAPHPIDAEIVEAAWEGAMDRLVDLVIETRNEHAEALR